MDESSVLGEIAADLFDPERIRQEAEAQERARPDVATAFVAPRTAVERTVAGVMAGVLGLDRVGVDDDFYVLGGDSLMATQVLLRAGEAFQVELSMDVLLSSPFSVARVAEAVDWCQVEAADEQDIADLLAELDGLSDEEVTALLDEQAASAGDRDQSGE